MGLQALSRLREALKRFSPDFQESMDPTCQPISDGISYLHEPELSFCCHSGDIFTCSASRFSKQNKIQVFITMNISTPNIITRR